MLFYLFSDSVILPVIFILITGHLTSICSSLYLHRSITHKSVSFSPVISIAMRFWLWLGTGMNTKEWVATHRKHHSCPDKEGDPHSPVVYGLWAILLNGLHYYRKAAKDQTIIEKYGKGCPEDWLETKLFTPYRSYGLFILLGINILLLGFVWGFAAWGVQMLWMPFIGQIVNGIGHAFGYRNADSKDHSTNIIPIGVLIVGEELHNNHHADPASAKFSAKWYEFDLGWVYIKILSWLKLASIKYNTPRLKAMA
jgi:stearoyl-CoA desaturase (delta-9 desaturase)